MSETKLVSLEEVAKHSSRTDVWFIIEGFVYDVTHFLDEHPGGEEVMLELAGMDATEGFDQIGHSDDAREMLKKFLVGKLDPKDLPAAGAVKKEAVVESKEEKPQGTSHPSTVHCWTAPHPGTIITRATGF